MEAVAVKVEHDYEETESGAKFTKKMFYAKVWNLENSDEPLERITNGPSSRAALPLKNYPESSPKTNEGFLGTSIQLGCGKCNIF